MDGRTAYDAAEIFRDTGCRRAMGIHWGTWALTAEDVEGPPKMLRNGPAYLSPKASAVTSLGHATPFVHSRASCSQTNKKPPSSDHVCPEAHQQDENTNRPPPPTRLPPPLLCYSAICLELLRYPSTRLLYVKLPVLFVLARTSAVRSNKNKE